MAMLNNQRVYLRYITPQKNPKHRSQIIGASDLLCPLKLLSELLCLLFPTGLEIRLDLQEFLLAESHAMVDAMDVPSRRI